MKGFLDPRSKRRHIRLPGWRLRRICRKASSPIARGCARVSCSTCYVERRQMANRDNGNVAVDVRAEASGSVRIAIQDTGAGLRPDQLASLFQPFNRLGQEAGKVEGTGIGLVVTKRLVELMGGTIAVKSTAGVGSVFSIEGYSRRMQRTGPTRGWRRRAPAAERRGAARGRAGRRDVPAGAARGGQPGQPAPGARDPRPARRPAPDLRARRAPGHRARTRAPAAGRAAGHQPAGHERARGTGRAAGRSDHGAHPGRGHHCQCDGRRRGTRAGRRLPALRHQADRHGASQRRHRRRVGGGFARSPLGLELRRRLSSIVSRPRSWPTKRGAAASRWLRASRCVVGATRFERATLWSQTRCATKLRYAPKTAILPARTEQAIQQGVVQVFVDEIGECFHEAVVQSAGAVLSASIRRSSAGDSNRPCA